MTQFKDKKRHQIPQNTKSGEPYTQEQLDLGIFEMQKRSFMRFIKKGPVDYRKIDVTMFFTVALLITQGYVNRNKNTLSFGKEFV